MKIPLHWSKATTDISDRKGRPAYFLCTCWRSSDISPEDAHRSALAAATRAIQRFKGDQPPVRYPYGDVPLREEVVQRFEDSQGELYAAVTRNSYGSLILNTARAMFIDIDFPPAPRSGGLLSFLARLFGKATPPPDPQQDPEETVKSRLVRFLDERRDWGLRLYRTAAGVRGLVTHDLLDPTADATLATLKAVGADPLYVRLCKAGVLSR